MKVFEVKMVFKCLLPMTVVLASEYCSGFTRTLKVLEFENQNSRPTNPGAGGGGVLTIMGYTGRLRPKGVPFSGFRYKKG